MAQNMMKIPVPSVEEIASWDRLENVQEYLVKKGVVSDDPDEIDGAVLEICLRYFSTQVHAQNYRRNAAQRTKAILAKAKEMGIEA